MKKKSHPIQYNNFFWLLIQRHEEPKMAKQINFNLMESLPSLMMEAFLPLTYFYTNRA